MKSYEYNNFVLDRLIYHLNALKSRDSQPDINPFVNKKLDKKHHRMDLIHWHIGEADAWIECLEFSKYLSKGAKNKYISIINNYKDNKEYKQQIKFIKENIFSNLKD